MLYLAVLFSCGPKAPKPQSMSIAPSSNVYLRNAFDMDPSSYIGRFVADGENNLDEASAMSMSCSQYISHRFVEGGGVKYNEILNVSSSVAAQIGVPIVAAGKGSYGSTGVVRVQYELTGKMLSEINDPDAFAKCCKEKPDQCTHRYIGEFLQGKGAVYTQVQKGSQVKAEGIDPTSGVKGGTSFSHGVEWERGIEFPNPVYFAFKVNKTPYAEYEQCGDWMNTVPESNEGSYFVGVSELEATEEKARKSAKKSARREAGMAMSSIPEGSSVQMNPKDWCIDTSYNNGVKQYKARVLMLMTVVEGPAPAPGQPTDMLRPPAQSSPVQGPPAGGDGSFGSLLRSLERASFSDDKLKVVLSVSEQSFSCAQVAQILATLSFEDDRFTALNYLKSTITDPQNSAVIEEQFDFIGSKEKVRSILAK
ncbi:MAG: hypothetical protein CMK59_08020 [Proteobacteria bacterium]|nr:hypothetical protein [Pseudomonadota bacterium]